MPIAYTIDLAQKIIFETWIGPISADDLERYWASYMADARVMALRRTVVDLREAEILFTGSELLDLVSRVVAPRLGAREWRTALIVNDPAQFGISRQYHVFASFYSRDAIFFDRDSAVAWMIGGAPA